MVQERRMRTLFYILISLPQIISCSKETGMDTAKESYPPLVEEYVCRNELLLNELSTYGSISYINKADVVPMSSENIQELYFEEGEEVQKGDILALLDTRKLEIQLEETKAGIEVKRAALVLAQQKLAESRRNMEAQFHTIKSAEVDLKQKRADLERSLSVLENKKLLFEAGGITQEELFTIDLSVREKESALKQAEYGLSIKRIGFREEDLIQGGYEIPEDREQWKNLYVDLNTRVQSGETELARSEWQAAQRRIKTLELYIEECRIKAPISGIIARKYMNKGERALENQPLYLIYPTKSVFALLQLSENDLLSVKLGQDVFIRNDTEGTEIMGRIHRISPWIQKESRSGEVKVLLDNSEDLFKIGQFVRVRIQLENPAEKLMIPIESLAPGEKSSVFIIRQNRLFLKEITIGEEIQNKYPLLDGLREGDRIVASPSETLRDGMEVQIK
jgi:multidrug resistance efflux pump